MTDDLEALLTKLRELPSEPLEVTTADRVRRRAVAVLEEERRYAAPKEPSPWAAKILPALLVVAGLGYVWTSVDKMERVYVGERAAPRSR